MNQNHLNLFYNLVKSNYNNKTSSFRQTHSKFDIKKSTADIAMLCKQSLI